MCRELKQRRLASCTTSQIWSGGLDLVRPPFHKACGFNTKAEPLARFGHSAHRRRVRCFQTLKPDCQPDLSYMFVNVEVVVSLEVHDRWIALLATAEYGIIQLNVGNCLEPIPQINGEMI
jgi:hypothetical protein